jgi:putative ABC transport system permease protein
MRAVKNIGKLSTRFLPMIRNIFLVAVRSFLRHPGPSTLNILGLAVGFTCMFLTILWVSNEFSFDKFHADHETIFKVMSHVESDGAIQTFDAASASIDISSVPEIKDVVTVSEGTRWPNELCFRPEGKADECIYLNGIFATPSFFSVFNFPIVEGDHDPLKNNPASMAISRKMAERLYGDVNPVGKVINIDDHFPVTVTGVFDNVPSNSSLQFEFVMAFPVFARMRGLQPEYFAQQFFTTFVKTNVNIAPEALTQKLNDDRVLPPKLKADRLSYSAFPLGKWRLNSKFIDGKIAGGRIEYVVIFGVIALLVVALAVINFVNLSTARATVRAKEIGIRKVTGAYRSNIITQFLSESFLVVLAAFILAALFTQLSLPFFSELLEEPIRASLTTGWVPVYLILFLLAVSVFAGVYPAFVMSSFQPIKVLKNQISGQQGSNRLRKMLLVVQLSVSIAILIFSGILYMQLDFIVNKDLGFDRQNMIRVEPTFKMLQQFDVFKNELSKSSSIVGTATAASNPLQVEAVNTGVSWPGKPENMTVRFQTFACSYEYPELMGLEVVDGRTFEAQSADTVNTEVLVTEDAVFTMALKNPVGEVIRIGNATCVIVGVLKDFHTQSLHEEKLPVILFRSAYTNTYSVYVKYNAGQTRQAMDALAAAYKNIEPKFTMKYWFMDDVFDKLYKQEKVASRLVLLFSVIALVIAALGIIGLATFNVMRRLKEMSIRKVFGATAAQILKLLTHEFAVIMILAILVAAPLVWYAADQWLSGFAYHVDMPWWLFGVCSLGVALLTMAIIFAQGVKAIIANPTEILRNE